ncbi:hypothetical protein RFI_10676 [Reticulomyxa filosa]|uniref:Uncharacterized protein n=1 Tax=Reticulomyxa filosa TaxID=46433 RepID=X6NKF7_RETFI|nr:hypothetical protein RFI_10676 [Reticulomyxa filosa]|eukprot:ETO26461.1 hypothetical protein RFI_10676 [Reticulomyxa filosa]
MRGGFLTSLLEKFLKLEMRKWMRLLGELDLLPQMFGADWRHTALQTSRGTVTIYPSPPLEDYIKVFNDPHIGRWKRYFSHGKKIIYPKMYMLQTRIKLQQLLRDSIEQIELKRIKQEEREGGVTTTTSSSTLLTTWGTTMQDGNDSDSDSDNDSDSNSAAAKSLDDRHAQDYKFEGPLADDDKSVNTAGLGLLARLNRFRKDQYDRRMSV